MKDKVDIRCPYCSEEKDIFEKVKVGGIQIYECKCSQKFRVEWETITYPVYCGKWE